MRKIRFSSLFAGLLLGLAVTAAGPDEIEFLSDTEAANAGWTGNNGGIISVTGGAETGSHALRVTGAREWGGLTWVPEELYWPEDAVVSFKIRQNLHPEFNFNLYIEVVQDDGSTRGITKVMPGGAGWGQWQEVVVDYKGEKLGRIGRFGLYTETFRDTTEIFLEIDDLKITGTNAEKTAEDFSNVYTLPLIDKAPVVDGVLRDGEYDRAGSMTGFVQLSGLYSPRQTSVWYCHDEENLYVVFSTIFESQGPPEKGKAGIMTQSDIHVGDLFELWIATPELQRQYVVNLNQGIFSYDYSQKAQADNTAIFKGTFTSNPFLVGGKWYGEFAIPKRNLPGLDKGLSVLFCRDFFPAGGRSESDWTSSKPMGGDFLRYDLHAKARLADKQERVAIDTFGDWGIGEAVLHGRLAGFADPVNLSMQLFDGEGNKIKEFSQAASNGDFTIGERLKMNKKIDGLAYFQVTDPANGNIIHAQNFAFACGSPLRFQCFPIIADGSVAICFDTRGIPALPAGTVAEVKIASATETVYSCEFPLNDKPQSYDFRRRVSGLAYQSYRIECRLMHDGKELLGAVEPEVWLGTPPWSRDADETPGIPIPWTPIKINDDQITLLARSYTLAANGLPAAINALGKEILHDPAELHLSVNGKNETISFAPLTLTESSDEQLTYAIKGQSDSLRFYGTLTIDYDGFARWRMQVAPDAALTLDYLDIAWSMPEDRAIYARGNRIGGTPAGYSANLDRSGPVKVEEIANSTHSYRGWIWEKDFFYNFMIGDDRTGFTFMTESDRCHKGDRHIAVNNRDETREVRLTLTSNHALGAGEILSYDYAWSGLPLKFEPDDPRYYHQGYAATRESDVSLLDADIDLFHQMPLLVGAWYMRHESYWELEKIDPAERIPNIMTMDGSDFTAGLQRAHDAGCQVITEGIFFAAMNTNIAETKRHMSEWKVMPGGYSWYNNLGALNMAACANSSWSDFIETVCRRILDETPLQGVYLDVATEAPCNNILHGCGYVDEQGVRRQTVNLWGTRELHKRVYTYYHTGSRQGKMLHHYLNNAAWAGFCDAGLQGEDWSIYQDYRKMTPDFFRAMKMTQYGTPYTFFAMFLYWQTGDLDEVMAICLPHRVYPAVWAYRRDNYPEIKPYWAIMDPWWCDSEFVGYWAGQAPTDAPRDENILVSAYIKPGKVLLTVANWQYEAKSLHLKLNLEVIPGKVRRVRELLSDKEITMNENNTIPVSIPERNVIVIELEIE